VSGGYSLVGEENTARVEVYAYSSNGDYWPAATASYGAGWFGAMVGSTYGTPYTTVYCILHYWWRGGQYWTGTSYQLHH
jgi:hypothetical protein